MRLAEAQDLFAALVTGEHPVDPAAREAFLVGDAGLSASGRARIYSDMYLFRLVDALREDYPLLARLLGDEEFFSLCADYVRAHPSRHPSLARLGWALPGFLRDRAAPRADLSDLAALEWARAEAFVAADAGPLDETALRSLGEDAASARLVLQAQAMFFHVEEFFVKREDLCRASRPSGGELIRRVCQNLFEMPGCRHVGFWIADCLTA